MRWFNGLNNTFVTPNFAFDGSFTGIQLPDGSTQPNTGDPLADLLVGYAAQAQTAQPTPLAQTASNANVTNFYEQQYAPWIQDDWKVTPRLTLNAGLRYDFHTRPKEQNDKTFWINPSIKGGGLYVGSKQIIDQGLGGNLYQYGGRPAPGNTQWKVFAPRVGLAYRATADGKRVIRAGYGSFYDSTESKEANGGANYPFGLQTNEQFVKISTLFPPVTSLQPVTPAQLGFLFITTPDVHTPYMQDWTLSANGRYFPGISLR